MSDPERQKELDRCREQLALARVCAWSFNTVTREVTWSKECRELYGVGNYRMLTQP